jgi:hypothetical protein
LRTQQGKEKWNSNIRKRQGNPAPEVKADREAAASKGVAATKALAVNNEVAVNKAVASDLVKAAEANKADRLIVRSGDPVRDPAVNRLPKARKQASSKRSLLSKLPHKFQS